MTLTPEDILTAQQISTPQTAKQLNDVLSSTFIITTKVADELEDFKSRNYHRLDAVCSNDLDDLIKTLRGNGK